jgi:hypothetical protein
MPARYLLPPLTLLCMILAAGAVHGAGQPDAHEPYTEAFEALADGQWDLAYSGLAEVQQDYPDTVHGRHASRHLARLDELGLSGRRRIDQRGRAETVGFGVLYGAWAGLATTILVDEDDDEKSMAAGMMLGAPVALITSLAATRGRQMTRGQASLLRLGGYFGTWQGLGLSLLSDDVSENTGVGAALAGGLAGIGIASVAGAVTQPSTGQAALVNYGALWGTWLTFAGTQVVDMEDGDAVLATTLVGGVAGVAAGALLASKVELREGRANLINLGGIAGTVMASGLLILLQPDEQQTGMAVVMAGGVLGLVAAARRTKEYAQPAERPLGGPAE